MKVGQYCIQIHRGIWIIRQCVKITLGNNGSIHYAMQDAPGETFYYDRTEALRRSFELNGWKWPPKPRKL